DLAAAPGGAVYATELTYGPCGPTGCPRTMSLARVDADGSVAAAFGGFGRVSLAANPGTRQGGSPVFDRQGGAVIAVISGSRVAVWRFLADGTPDASFGSAGVSSFDCGCMQRGGGALRLAIDDEGRIVVSITTYEISETVTLARLLPRGALDR